MVDYSVFFLFCKKYLKSTQLSNYCFKGAVPKGNATKEMIKQMGFREGQVIFKCTKCCSIKPERAHHCSVCQRCIRKMDHHCPWVNNCVGENNQKYFVLFTVSKSETSMRIQVSRKVANLAEDLLYLDGN